MVQLKNYFFNRKVTSMNKQLLPALLVILAIGLVGYYLLKNDDQADRQLSHNTTDLEQTKREEQPSTSELKIEDVKVGEGADAQEGKTVLVHYVGTLANGEKFDSSRDRDEPFDFTLGGGEVIQGWDEGVAGMKVGGVRKLTIPPELGYGSADLGKIPPNSTLIFEIELLEVK